MLIRVRLRNRILSFLIEIGESDFLNSINFTSYYLIFSQFIWSMLIFFSWINCTTSSRVKRFCKIFPIWCLICLRQVSLPAQFSCEIQWKFLFHLIYKFNWILNKYARHICCDNFYYSSEILLKVLNQLRLTLLNPYSMQREFRNSSCLPWSCRTLKS